MKYRMQVMILEYWINREKLNESSLSENEVKCSFFYGLIPL